MTTSITRTETFMRPITLEKSAELSKEQSNLALRRISIEGEKSQAAATFNAQLKEIRKKIETLAKAVRDGAIEETIEVREEHDVNARTVTTYEVESGTKLRDRQMTDAEVRRALGIDTPLFDGVSEEQASKPKRGRRARTSEPDTSILDDEGGVDVDATAADDGASDTDPAPPPADDEPKSDYWYCAPCDKVLPAREGDGKKVGDMRHKCGWMMSFNSKEGGGESAELNGQTLTRVPRGRGKGRKAK
ncbi:MAG TPA: hypothetical protein VFU97_24595 [Xanthobacteraceae bacterium]|nr:hypothetical protein [Xanthobacteraceae bacterium]